MDILQEMDAAQSEAALPRQNGAAARWRAAPDEANGSPACAVPAIILNLGSRLVACRDHQALPRGNAHRSACGAATSLREHWFKERIAGSNTAGDGTTTGKPRTRSVHAEPGVTAARTVFPGLPAPGRSPFASTGFYAALRRRQFRRRTTAARPPLRHAFRAAVRARS